MNLENLLSCTQENFNFKQKKISKMQKKKNDFCYFCLFFVLTKLILQYRKRRLSYNRMICYRAVEPKTFFDGKLYISYPSEQSVRNVLKRR
jgi:hypothetical protein